MPGDWEVDLIMESENKSAIPTLVERTTRYTIIILLKNKDIHSIRKTMKKGFKNIPLYLRNLLHMIEAKK